MPKAMSGGMLMIERRGCAFTSAASFFLSESALTSKASRTTTGGGSTGWTLEAQLLAVGAAVEGGRALPWRFTPLAPPTEGAGTA